MQEHSLCVLHFLRDHGLGPTVGEEPEELSEHECEHGCEHECEHECEHGCEHGILRVFLILLS